MPKERRESGQNDLFRARLDPIVDLGHPLAKLARAIDWRFLEGRFGAVHSTSHLRALGLADLRVTPDLARLVSEAALWGAIEAEGLLGQTVIVSDDAGQFRVGDHALCRVGGDVASPAPHRSGRADYPHPVLHAQGSLGWRRTGERGAMETAAGVARANGAGHA
jgi:hypothetical protein